MGRFLGDEDSVPSDKRHQISTRDNSAYKWQQDGGVQHTILGALEVHSEPDLQVHEPLSQRFVAGDGEDSPRRQDFEAACRVWDDWNLREEFVKACDNVPPETCCCGLLPDSDNTIKVIVKSLNKGWVRKTNQRLQDENKGFKLHLYLWTWHNVSGKAETNVLLVRFISTKKSSKSKQQDGI